MKTLLKILLRSSLFYTAIVVLTRCGCKKDAYTSQPKIGNGHTRSAITTTDNHNGASAPPQEAASSIAEETDPISVHTSKTQEAAAYAEDGRTMAHTIAENAKEVEAMQLNKQPNNYNNPIAPKKRDLPSTSIKHRENNTIKIEKARKLVQLSNKIKSISNKIIDALVNAVNTDSKEVNELMITLKELEKQNNKLNPKLESLKQAEKEWDIPEDNLLQLEAEAEAIEKKLLESIKEPVEKKQKEEKNRKKKKNKKEATI